MQLAPEGLVWCGVVWRSGAWALPVRESPEVLGTRDETRGRFGDGALATERPAGRRTPRIACYQLWAPHPGGGRGRVRRPNGPAWPNGRPWQRANVPVTNHFQPILADYPLMLQLPNRIEVMAQAGIHDEQANLDHIPAGSEPIAWELSRRGRRTFTRRWLWMAHGDDRGARCFV
jgi:hypothetical protein